ncbi:MAG TPA: bacteriohemerythrin [Spirochaetota bacterium]|nr:bacteriohemerythrin [Spirochaetota bacterium]HPI88524.1 bacteriohemerythrin [Spirochaetota bacterium]HPR48004.1 bacteriohemerythrin [Spirochaetota bacterium]
MRNKVRVLFASEDDASRMKVRSLLNTWNETIDITEARSCEEALETVAKSSFDCLVMAEGPGNCHPLEHISDFKNSENSIPLIMLSGSQSELYAVKTIKAGAYDYLPLGIIEEPGSDRLLYDAIMNSVSRSERKAEKKRKHIALQLSEERYRGLIEHSPILIIRFFIDDGIIDFVNDGFCRYFSLGREQVLGEPITFFLSENAREAFQEKVKNLTDKNPVASFEMSSKVGGKKLWQQWTVQVLFDKAGNPVEYQCMGEDITNLKMSNQMLNKTLDKIRDLKNMQDGDYFLTSLILDPLGRNHAVSDILSVDFFVKQYKEFKFKKWNSAIGGDICYSHNIYLDGKIYIVFLNADAMGKSMQGAGGALVLGAVFQSIIDRSRFSSDEQDLYPEQWLKRSFLELQKVFEVFNGSMLISLVMGLVEEETGLMYYINAEHPWTVLYRGRKASFLEGGRTLRKIGTQAPNTIISVQTFQLKPGDVIIVGSDGRDEIVLKNQEGDETEINQDEKLFLSMVEKGGGELKTIYESIIEKGEVRDDVSFIRLYYSPPLQEDNVFGEIMKVINAYKNLDENTRKAEGAEILEAAIKRYGEHPFILRELARFLYESGEYYSSYRTGRKLLYLDSSNTEEVYLVSFSAMQAGELFEAEKLVDRAYLRMPDDLKYLSHYARILLTNEKYSEAYSIINEIMAIDPADINAMALQNELDNKMAIIKWNDRYLVNIKSIDEQHIKLVEMINKLKISLSQNEDSEVIKSILVGMGEYAREHFDLEERFMRETDYPLFGEHKREHDYFKREIARFQKYFYAGRARLTAQILTFLSSWFKGHLMGTDRKYIEHFIKSGIT